MDDSDVEVVSEKKRLKTEDDASDERPRRQRPRLHIEVDDVVIVEDADDLSTPALTTTSATSTPSPASSPALSSSSLPDNTAVRWPTGVHVVDMVAGFQKMDSPELAAYDREERFKRAFVGYLYRPSTVTKHRTIYHSVTRAELKKGVAAGRKTEGLWSIWRKQRAVK